MFNTSFFRFQHERSQNVPSKGYLSVIGEQPIKLYTATLESEMIENSVQKRRSTTIKLDIIVRISAMLASRALQRGQKKSDNTLWERS